jgi:hypothetical protein
MRCFLDGVQPEEDFCAGLEVTELLMTAYLVGAGPAHESALAEKIHPG